MKISLYTEMTTGIKSIPHSATNILGLQYYYLIKLEISGNLRLFFIVFLFHCHLFLNASFSFFFSSHFVFHLSFFFFFTSPFLVLISCISLISSFLYYFLYPVTIALLHTGCETKYFKLASIENVNRRNKLILSCGGKVYKLK